VIPGHEWAGEVVQVGRRCAASASGTGSWASASSATEHFGFSISGAAAEFFVAKESWLHRLPDNLSWTQGALVEPFSCGYYATVRADNLDASDTVVVLGAGPIGLGRGRGRRPARAPGSSSPSPARRGDLARTLGAEDVLDPTGRGFLDAVAGATGGAAPTWSSRPAASRPRWPPR
jgi:threonine dehydrogenase-like Zn-dependent dehydrogenase